MATDRNKQKAQPAYPVNVRVEHKDGTHTPVESIYGGEKEGIHHWFSVRPVDMKDGDKKVADEMPANTEVHLYSLTNG